MSARVGDVVVLALLSLGWVVLLAGLIRHHFEYRRSMRDWEKYVSRMRSAEAARQRRTR